MTTGNQSQSEVIAFLRHPGNWPNHPATVEVIETHGALVFMAGDDVLKIRRAIRLPYLDFSTLQARRHFAEREVELNQPRAPGLYGGVVAITREPNGHLALDGSGEPVEWAVRMAHFDQTALLQAVVVRGEFTEPLAKALADEIFAYHQSAPAMIGAADRTAIQFQSVLSCISTFDDARVQAEAKRIVSLAQTMLDATAECRRERVHAGFVRRCHGDLHLGNIVLWRGHPTLFDAIEFDEVLATIDTLYDLGFLLMDLDRHQARAAANTVLNRYLWRSGAVSDLRALAALPLFLSLRAAIRAMVALDRVKLGVTARDTSVDDVRATLRHAAAYLAPTPPRLVAVGGLSGSGKSTIAKQLAPLIGRAPGALHLRSDLERKWLAGVGETDRLPSESYSPETSAQVYDRVCRRAEAALTAGHSVVLDAVYAREPERAAVAEIARRVGCAFTGLWLSAPADILKARVASRTHDASDATPAVVDRQLTILMGAMSWHAVDASGDLETCLANAHAALAL